MLTVKWQYKLNGAQVEHVYEAERVTTVFRNDFPADQTVASNAPKTQHKPSLRVCGREVDDALVILDGWDLDGQSFGCGKIYVMNGQGSTVASYDLGNGDQQVATEIPVATAPALAA